MRLRPHPARKQSYSPSNGVIYIPALLQISKMDQEFLCAELREIQRKADLSPAEKLRDQKAVVQRHLRQRRLKKRQRWYAVKLLVLFSITALTITGVPCYLGEGGRQGACGLSAARAQRCARRIFSRAVTVYHHDSHDLRRV